MNILAKGAQLVPSACLYMSSGIVGYRCEQVDTNAGNRLLRVATRLISHQMDCEQDLDLELRLPMDLAGQ